MAKVYYPNYNGVFSTLHDTIERPEESNLGADSILIVGVAKKGPMKRHITVDDTNIDEVFGNTEGMTPAELERSAIKGFHEIRASQTAPSNIAIMRVGNARRAGLRLFENRVYASGNFTYTDPAGGGYTTSLLVEALEDGEQEFSIDVDADELGKPISARVRMPYINEEGEEDINDTMFALDIEGAVEGAFSKPSQLAGAINADPVFNQKVFAGVPLLNKEITIPIVQASGLPVGTPKKTYDIEDDIQSYGDKLYGINKIYSYKDVTETVPAGTSTFTAVHEPNKSADVSDMTISLAYVSKDNETLVQNLTMSQVGGNTATLKCAVDGTWDNSVPATAIIDLAPYIIRGGVRTELASGDYSLNGSTGEITFDTAGGKPVENGFQLGDVIGTDYKYKVSLSEAKNRSNLIRGNKRSYFAIGKDIIFGEAIANDLVITYESIIEYEMGADAVIGNPSDPNVDGYKDAIFTFVNIANMPAVGDTVYVDFDYEPELPAPTGYVFPDDVTIQLGGLTGGSNGTALSLYDYKKETDEAFQESENYPCRFIVVQGAYFDDNLDGYNDETGLPEQQNVGWHTLLKHVTDIKSNYVTECEYVVTHRPLLAPDASGAYTQWLTNMTKISISDPLRPANISKTIVDFRSSVIAGEVNGSGMPGQGIYPLYTPNILVAMKSELPLGETLTHKQLPGNILGMRYLIKSARDIDALNAMRFTTLGIEVENLLDQTLSAVKIMDAPTMAAEGSQFDRQSTYRAMVEGLRVIRRTLKPFIGKMLDSALLITINNRLNTSLQGLIPAVLKAFVIDVKASRGQMLKGTTAVTFHGVTGAEVRRFEVDSTASKVA